MSATAFWQEHQVGGPYATLKESNVALAERAALYPELYELMPVTFPGKTVLDYGCGPGHDTLLFLLNRAAHVHFFDVSELALQMTWERLQMYGLADYANAVNSELPRVDHIHCAGVLHHMEDPLDALVRLREAGPQMRVMVYDGERSEHTQSDVPITEWWTPTEFLALAREAGWEGEHVGSYPCSAEWRPNCLAACYSLC